MRSGFRIGRVFGIDLTVDWSWLFIVLLLTWNLAAVFARWHPAWGGGLDLVVALAAALLFFASVLVHELAHSLAARAMGMRVHSITLFLFGGVSNIEREPPSARAEFLIAIVGPLTSLAIGALCLLLAGGAAGPFVSAAAASPRAIFAQLGPLGTLLAWLGPANVMVGLFNLVPGFPLDGGRIVRAALWGATKNLERATRHASRIGQLIGWAFVVAGVAMAFGVRVPLLGAGAGGGLWIAFIGWFLSSAAAQSYQQMLAHRALEGVLVAQLMRTRGITVDPTARVAELVQLFVTNGGGEQAFPVVNHDGDLLGMVGLTDVRRVPRERWGATAVADAMTPREALVTAAPDEPVADALPRMGAAGLTQLPVLVHATGRLVGLLRLPDVGRWIEAQTPLVEPHGVHPPRRSGQVRAQ